MERVEEAGTVDQTVPEGKWEFDRQVTLAFDDMLARSIPQYEVMREAVFDVACQFEREGTDIVDMGCSRGQAIRKLMDRFGAHNCFIGIEVSEPMIEAFRKEYAGWLSTGYVRLCTTDLRKGFPPCRACVIQSVLTLQFTPIEHRLAILKRAYDHLLPGGAFILVEKVIGATAEIDALLTLLYYKLKADKGYSQDQIERKRLSLEGILVPVTAKWNEEMLRATGFKQIDCFWRWMNFGAWLAVK